MTKELRRLSLIMVLMFIALFASTIGIGLAGGAELRFSGARTSVAWLDTEVPGGAWAGAGAATERARIEIGRPGRVEPRVSWVRTRTASGTRSEARLAVTWSTEPSNPEIAR